MRIVYYFPQNEDDTIDLRYRALLACREARQEASHALAMIRKARALSDVADRYDSDSRRPFPGMRGTVERETERLAETLRDALWVTV